MADALITRCPACRTAFRAGEAQLLARNGQVRCGHCDTVFNAYANVLSQDRCDAPQDKAPEDSVAPHSVSDAELPAVVAANDKDMSPREQLAEAAPQANVLEDADPVGPRHTNEAGETVHPGPAAHDEPTLQDPMETPTEDVAEIRSEALVWSALPALPPVAPADGLFQAPGELPTPADLDSELDFGRKERPVGRISRWLARLALAALCLLFLLQVTFHFRGDLALLFPEAKPPLEEICVLLGCDLPLPQRADMMSIESSDLKVDTLRPNIMVLSATLRNRAPFAQRAPALELTLTDARDQPLARRVLTATDYLPDRASRPISAGMEIPVRVYFDASAVKPTGYRLYLFYP